MSDPSVDRWRQKGNLYLWRSRDSDRNYPGWNCVTNEVGRQSMIELFDLLRTAEYKSKRTVKVTTPPFEVLRLPGSPVEKWIAPPSIKIVYPQSDVPENHWQWSGELKSPTLILGTAKLEALRNAFETVARYGDFCIHADDQKQHGFDFEKMSIWFWPT